jgi:ABC-type transport system involved in cytochrome bd biosynthesis fused ATPase/permease subunit
MTKLFQFLFQKMTDRSISCSILILVLILITIFFYGYNFTIILLISLISIPLFIIFLLRPTESLIGKLRERYTNGK